MTRINIIPPRLLADQHLIAESAKEINQLCGHFKRTVTSKTGLIIDKIPKSFTLNEGHVYFFYDKGKYLLDRFEELAEEVRRRKFAQNTKFHNVWLELGQTHLLNNWEPSKEDMKVVIDRIIDRVENNPFKPKPDGWYTYEGKSITNKEYCDKLRNYLK